MSIQRVVLLSTLVLLGWACNRGTEVSANAPNQSGPKNAAAEIKDRQGARVGSAKFTEVQGGVRVTVEAEKLPPGPHGVHIHEVGKCEPPDFKSAGGHFNPTGKQHGSLNPKGPHAGDLGNLQVSREGKGVLEAVARGATVNSGSTSLLRPGGTAIVIHAGPDDLKTDPAGNSGDRIACGAILR